jgi:hypothetical protein
MGKVDIALSENFMGCAEVSIVREQSAGHRATGNTGAMFKILVFSAILGYFEKSRKTFNVATRRSLRRMDCSHPQMPGEMN